MKTGRFKYLKSLALFALLATGGSASLLAEPKITARVSSNEVALNNQLTLTLEISGLSNIGFPNLNIPDFQVQRAGQTQSFQWINGETSSLLGFNYVLSPLKAGTLTIPVLTLNHEGKTYSTQPISVNVVDNSGGISRPAGSDTGEGSSANVPTESLKPVFMTANVDKAKAYVGEQILLKILFYRRPDIAIQQPSYNEPELTGFVVEPIKQQEYTSNLNGTPYVTTELRYALFPTSDGEFVIGSARIDVPVRSNVDPFDPNSFFQNFFGQSKVMKLSTRAIPIQVRALPKNKPANFSGAVGRYKMTARVDAADLEVGKPFNLILNVEGLGSIKSLKEPTLPELKSFRKYETISTIKQNNEGKMITGSKEFKTALIPQASGNLNIPSLEYSYFNSETGGYETLTTPEIPLKVKPGTLSSNAPLPEREGAATTQGTEGIRVVDRDIRYIKSGKLESLEVPLYRNPLFLVINFLPPLFFLGAALASWKNRRRSLYASHFRAKEALQESLRYLRKAKKHLNGHDHVFYTELYNGLALFFSSKFGLSSSGLIWNELENKLSSGGVSAELRIAVRELFDEADLARFATTEFTLEQKVQSLKKTHEILKQLNRVL